MLCAMVHLLAASLQAKQVLLLVCAWTMCELEKDRSSATAQGKIQHPVMPPV